MCRLSDGRVLMIVGAGTVLLNDPVMSAFGYGTLICDSDIHAQLFDPATNTWSRVPNMPRIAGEDDRFPDGLVAGCRQQPLVVATSDGRAIVAGGYMGLIDQLPDASTTLSSDVDDSATTIPVASTDGFPPIGRFALDGEWIDYSAKTATCFTGCRRGALPWYGATAHAGGTSVVRIRVHDRLVEDPDAPGALQDNNYRKSALVFDPALFDAGKDPWVRIADMNYPRTGSVLVPIDERRFYCGNNGGNPVAIGNPWGGWPRNEIYDLAANSWTPTAAMDQAGFDIGFEIADFIYFGGQADPVLAPGGQIITLSAGGNVSDFGNSLGCIYHLGHPSTENKRSHRGAGRAPAALTKRTGKIR
jgi:hypothetical protein